jgi:hypothetical protein
MQHEVDATASLATGVSIADVGLDENSGEATVPASPAT